MGKALDKVRVLARRRLQFRRARVVARSRNLHHARGVRSDFLHNFGTSLQPRLAVQAIERHRIDIRAIVPDFADIVGGNEQFRAVGKTQADGFARVLFACVDLLEAFERRHAMLDMHDDVAEMKFGTSERGQRRRLLSAATRPTAAHIRCCDCRDVLLVDDKTRIERCRKR